MARIASGFIRMYIGVWLMKGLSHLLNEIMPMIYKRFTEKAAEEWRQIYKVWTLEIVGTTEAHTQHVGSSAA